MPDLNVTVFRINRTSLKDPLMQFLCFFCHKKKASGHMWVLPFFPRMFTLVFGPNILPWFKYKSQWFSSSESFLIAFLTVSQEPPFPRLSGDCKHRKNCECCPVSQLIVRYWMIVWIQVLNCQKCNQCLKCQVSNTIFPIVNKLASSKMRKLKSW